METILVTFLPQNFYVERDSFLLKKLLEDTIIFILCSEDEVLPFYTLKQLSHVNWFHGTAGSNVCLSFTADTKQSKCF